MEPPGAPPEVPPEVPCAATPGESFVLMLHDRVVELEARLAALAPAATDAAVTILGGRDASHGGAVFARCLCAEPIDDLDACMRAALEALARTDNTRYDVWCCRHWSLGMPRTPYVIECLVQRSGCGAEFRATRVAHAVLDAARASAGDAYCRVEACAVTCTAWFAESVRSAAAANGRAVLHTWDPSARCALVTDAGDDREAIEDPGARRAWITTTGWLASFVDVTDVWHPRAISAHAKGAEFVDLVARVREDQAGLAVFEAAVAHLPPPFF